MRKLYNTSFRYSIMKTIKLHLLAFTVLIINYHVWASLKYHPISFVLNTDKDSYYEGEKITFNITITNTSKETSYPVLLPHTQNIGQKLFYINDWFFSVSELDFHSFRATSEKLCLSQSLLNCYDH